MLGAFVQELDRPWLDTPFLIQGFLLDNEDDLATLRAYCKHAYVDHARSAGAAVMAYAPSAAEQAAASPQPPKPAPKAPQIQVSLASEVDVRRKAPTGAKSSVIEDLTEVLKETLTAQPVPKPAVASSRPAVVSMAEEIDVSAGRAPARATAGTRPPKPAARRPTMSPPTPDVHVHADYSAKPQQAGLLRQIVDTLKEPTPGRAGPRAKPAPARELAEASLSGLFYVEDNRVLASPVLREAQGVHDRAKTSMRSIIKDLQKGGRLDLEMLNEAVDDMVDTVNKAPEAMIWLTKLKKKDNYTYDHGLDSAIYMTAFGRHLGFPKNDLHELALAGMLFDVGKLRLPDELLARPGKLTPQEFNEVRRHVEYGLDMLAGTPQVTTSTLEIIAQHHERWNGSGYPIGLKGNEIALFARMAGIVDCFEAMTSSRPYADALPPHQALRALHDWRDVSFAGALVDQFLQCIGVFPVGTLVEVNSGEVGIVIAQNRIRRLQPKVMVLLGADKAPLKFPVVLDLLNGPTFGDDQTYSITRDLPVGSYGVDASEFFLGED
jgi:HD-GYP domain-containing protein (c-di-GMP phosphodiesterase class II)